MTRVTPGQRQVVILGSGFSRAIAKPMPTLSELRDLVLSDLGMEAQQLDMFGGNLEQWMFFIAVDQPWLSDADNFANRSLFERVRESLARCITTAENSAPIRFLTGSFGWFGRGVSRKCPFLPLITTRWWRGVSRASAACRPSQTFTQLRSWRGLQPAMAPFSERTIRWGPSSTSTSSMVQPTGHSAGWGSAERSHRSHRRFSPVGAEAGGS
jgi:hypothetical protein